MLTEPIPLATPPAEGATQGTNENRVRALHEIRALLRQFVDGDVPLTLTAPDGTAYTTSLWAEDPQRGVVVFAADPREPRVQRIAEADEVLAVGYLDSVKVQFDVQDLMLVHGRAASALNAPYPREVYRFQRRHDMRVRPVGRSQPHARLVHPELPRRQIDLRVVDISGGGIALLLNEDLDLFRRDQVLSGVMVELDPGMRFVVSLRVAHVSVTGSPAARSRRIGCEMLDVSGAVLQDLQRYLDLNHKRRRLLTL